MTRAQREIPNILHKSHVTILKKPYHHLEPTATAYIPGNRDAISATLDFFLLCYLAPVNWLSEMNESHFIAAL